MNDARQRFNQELSDAAHAGNSYFELDLETTQRLCALYNLQLNPFERANWLESIELPDSDQIAAYVAAGDTVKISEMIATKLELYHRERVEELHNLELREWDRSRKEEMQIDRAERYRELRQAS